MVRVSGKDASRTLSGGWSNWEETPGQKRDTLEELLYIRIRIISLSWAGNEEKVAREKDILVCCHHDPVPGLVVENGCNLVKLCKRCDNCHLWCTNFCAFMARNTLAMKLA